MGSPVTGEIPLSPGNQDPISRLPLAVKAFFIATKEFRPTFLIFLGAGCLIVYFFQMSAIWAFALGIFSEHLHDFVIAYRKAYSELRSSAPRTKVKQLLPEIGGGKRPEYFEPRAQTVKPSVAAPAKSHLRKVFLWIIVITISLSALIILLFNLYLLFYR